MDNNSLMYMAVAALAAIVLVRRLQNKKASPALVRDKLAAGARVIDVRSPQEFAGGSFPKAQNIPVDSLPSRLGDLPKDRPIVLFCASGARSGRAARLLKKAGFTDVVSAGGLADMPR